jgi:hypothetical protein
MDTMSMAPVRTPIDIPEFERLEPNHTKGFQRVFALLRVALGWTPFTLFAVATVFLRRSITSHA